MARSKRKKGKSTAPAERPHKHVLAPRTLTGIVDRMERVERWLVDGMGPRRAAMRARQPPPDGLGLSRWMANRYVAAALARLQADTKLEPIESKRARIVAMTQGQIERALSLKRRFLTNGKLVEYDAPDLKAAGNAIDLLARIELGL